MENKEKEYVKLLEKSMKCVDEDRVRGVEQKTRKKLKGIK